MAGSLHEAVNRKDFTNLNQLCWRFWFQQEQTCLAMLRWNLQNLWFQRFVCMVLHSLHFCPVFLWCSHSAIYAAQPCPGGCMRCKLASASKKSQGRWWYEGTRSDIGSTRLSGQTSLPETFNIQWKDDGLTSYHFLLIWSTLKTVLHPLVLFKYNLKAFCSLPSLTMKLSKQRHWLLTFGSGLSDVEKNTYHPIFISFYHFLRLYRPLNFSFFFLFFCLSPSIIISIHTH